MNKLPNILATSTSGKRTPLTEPKTKSKVRNFTNSRLEASQWPSPRVIRNRLHLSALETSKPPSRLRKPLQIGISKIRCMILGQRVTKCSESSNQLQLRIQEKRAIKACWHSNQMRSSINTSDPAMISRLPGPPKSSTWLNQCPTLPHQAGEVCLCLVYWLSPL